MQKLSIQYENKHQVAILPLSLFEFIKNNLNINISINLLFS